MVSSIDLFEFKSGGYSAETLLVRAQTILSNMAKENDRKWWEFWVPRWEINDEPLRNDAQNLLPLIQKTLDKTS